MLYEGLEDKYFQTSLGKMHYKQHIGNGAEVIFLHGLAASTLTWTDLVEQLPDNLDLYLIDLLGHGDSDAPEMDYKISTHALTVTEFMEGKGLEESYLFGHSYGGWIAGFIAQGSYKCKGVILEDALGLKEYFDDIEKEGGVEEYKKKWIKQALILNPRESVIRSSITSETSSEYLTKESLSGLTKPTLVMWGSEDKLVDVKYANLFAKYIKGSRLEIVKGAGHVPHYTHSIVANKLLLEFIGYI